MLVPRLYLDDGSLTRRGLGLMTWDIFDERTGRQLGTFKLDTMLLLKLSIRLKANKAREMR